MRRSITTVHTLLTVLRDSLVLLHVSKIVKFPTKAIYSTNGYAPSWQLTDPLDLLVVMNIYEPRRPSHRSRMEPTALRSILVSKRNDGCTPNEPFPSLSLAAPMAESQD